MNDRATIDHLLQRLSAHLAVVYPDHDCSALAERIVNLFWPDPNKIIKRKKIAEKHLWDESDIAIITYGGSIRSEGERPLRTLHRFLKQHIGDTIGAVHILPFFPYSCDDGFGVIDYLSVDENLGDWSDIEAIAKDYRLMGDLVINHDLLQ